MRSLFCWGSLAGLSSYDTFICCPLTRQLKKAPDKSGAFLLKQHLFYLALASLVLAEAKVNSSAPFL
jgi:hypothetical protein